MSGFTKLNESFSALAGGAEHVTTHLNRYFTTLLDIVERYGGDVVKFAGDALIVVFTGSVGLGTSLCGLEGDSDDHEIMSHHRSRLGIASVYHYYIFFIIVLMYCLCSIRRCLECNARLAVCSGVTGEGRRVRCRCAIHIHCQQWPDLDIFIPQIGEHRDNYKFHDCACIRFAWLFNFKAFVFIFMWRAIFIVFRQLLGVLFCIVLGSSFTAYRRGFRRRACVVRWWRGR